MKLVIATRNKGKLKEYEALLNGLYEVVSTSDVGFFEDVEETANTFKENSYLKAKAVYDFCGLPSLADDSGLIVDALNGEPGVKSARYAGIHGDDEKNYKLLLKNMQNVKDRSARFETVITLITPEKTYQAVGNAYGEIAYEPSGSNGFGYDPVFYSFDLKKSFGNASDEEKNAVSHRSRALKDLLAQLKNSQ